MSDYDYHEYEHQRQTCIEAERLTDARMKSLFYRVERFGIRCARIACGLALAFGALLIFDSKTDVSQVPFAALTLGMIAGSLVSWGFGLAFIWWAFVAAFGAAPQRSELIGSFKGAAELTTKAARERATMNT